MPTSFLSVNFPTISPLYLSLSYSPRTLIDVGHQRTVSKAKHMRERGASAPTWQRPGGPSQLVAGGASYHLPKADAPGWAVPPSASQPLLTFRLKIIQKCGGDFSLLIFCFFLEWLMEADLSFSGWGGWSAPPPTTGGGRAAIQRPMNSIALHLAKRRRNPHVQSTSTSIGCNHWLSLAKSALKVALAGRNRSPVVRTSQCVWAITRPCELT